MDSIEDMQKFVDAYPEFKYIGLDTDFAFVC